MSYQRAQMIHQHQNDKEYTGEMGAKITKKFSGASLL